jgi:hypothetical protein
VHWVLVAQVQVLVVVSQVPFPVQSLSLQHSLVHVAHVLVVGSQYCLVPAVHWSLDEHEQACVAPSHVPCPVQSLARQHA